MGRIELSVAAVPHAAPSTCTSRSWTGAPASARSASRRGCRSTCGPSTARRPSGSPRASFRTSNAVRGGGPRRGCVLPARAAAGGVRLRSRRGPDRGARRARPRRPAACAGCSPQRAPRRWPAASPSRCCFPRAERSRTLSTTRTARTYPWRCERSSRRRASARVDLGGAERAARGPGPARGGERPARARARPPSPRRSPPTCTTTCSPFPRSTVRWDRIRSSSPATSPRAARRSSSPWSAGSSGSATRSCSSPATTTRTCSCAGWPWPAESC